MLLFQFEPKDIASGFIVVVVVVDIVKSLENLRSSCIIKSVPPPCKGPGDGGGLLRIPPTAAGDVNPYLKALEGC